MLRKVFIITGLSLNLIAAAFLFMGSKSVPWEIQTIGGQSPKEIKFKEIHQVYAKTGFGLLAAGFLLQLIGETKKKGEQ